MSQKKDVTQGNHSENSFTDEEAVSLIRLILAKHRRVMPNIDSQDKWPNIDGYLEIQNDSNQLIGKLEVQVKALPNEHKYKFQCPMKFIHYCKNVATLPVLLLLVDNTEEKVYWEYIDSGFISNMKYSDTQAKITIHFSEEKYFDRTKLDYLGDWENIVNEHKRRFKHYDELKEAYDTLQEVTNPIIGKSDLFFMRMHQFLDELNHLLDNELNVVKRTLYPNQWKLGLAYYQYDINKVRFTIYPIPLHKNDVQIKQVNKSLRLQLEDQGLGFKAHFTNNPIEENPKKYARVIAKEKFQILLKNKLLSHNGIFQLSQESIFAFVDKFYIQLGLKEKDDYTIEELKKALYIYLPLWVTETINFMIKVKRNEVSLLSDVLRPTMSSGGGLYLDPSYILSQVMNEERELIAQKVNEKMQDPNLKIPALPIGNKDFNFGIFNDLLNDLSRSGITDIKRLYIKKDYRRLENGRSWTWNLWSKEDTLENINIFLNNIVEVSKQLIENNFPMLEREFSLFGEVDKICVHVELKDEYKSYSDQPTCKIFYLKSESDLVGKSVELLSEDEKEYMQERFEERTFDTILDYKGERYKLISVSQGALDFIYEDFPMLHYIYKNFEETLKRLYK